MRGRSVKVLVGPEEVEYVFHEELLKQHSDFAAAALRNGWKEAEERVIRLSEEDPEIFDIFATFLYEGKIWTSREKDVYRAGSRTRDRECTRLAHCWVLGDKLISQTWKDALSDALVDKLRIEEFYPGYMQRDVYQNGGSNVPQGMQRLLVDIAIWVWDKRSWRRAAEKRFPGNFFRDVCLRRAEIKGALGSSTKPWLDAGCRYHDHGDDKPCYKTMF